MTPDTLNLDAVSDREEQGRAGRAAHVNKDAEAAFREEFLAIIPSMRAYARTLCAGNASLADDLAQEALTKAWQARASYAIGTNFKAWTFRILRNVFFSEHRKSRRQTSLDPEVAEATLLAVDNPDATLALDELRRGMARLSPEHREALILIGAAGLSYEEVAEVCGVAVGTVKSRVSRARTLLQALLERGDYGRDGVGASEAMDTLLADMVRTRVVRSL
jgi:RNA polymerase sigma-70 factor, ECF subfamily